MRIYAALMHELLEEAVDLTDEEFGHLCRMLLQYSSGQEVEAPKGNERYLWPRVRNQENRHQASYDNIARKRSAAGKLGAQKRWGQANDSNCSYTYAEDEANTDAENEANTDTIPNADIDNNTQPNLLPSVDSEPTYNQQPFSCAPLPPNESYYY